MDENSSPQGISKLSKGIIEAANAPEGEKIYLKKDFLGWRVVEPPTKWYHYILGSKRNAFILLILLILGLAFYLGITEFKSAILASDECLYAGGRIIIENIPATKVPGIIIP